MTHLVFLKRGMHYLVFRCSGHTGYAESGSDIVCAAVSAAVQMTADYLTCYFSDKVRFSADEDNAVISLVCNTAFSEADRQLETLERFSDSVSDQYPDYFKIDFTEV